MSDKNGSTDLRSYVPIDYPAAVAAVDSYFNEPDSPDERRTRYREVLAGMGDGAELGDRELANMRRMFASLSLDTVREHIKDHIEGDDWFGAQPDRYQRLHEAYRAAFELGAETGKPMVSLWNRTVEEASGTVIDTPWTIIIVINTPPIFAVSLKQDPASDGVDPADMLNPRVVHQSGVRDLPR